MLSRRGTIRAESDRFSRTDVVCGRSPGRHHDILIDRRQLTVTDQKMEQAREALLARQAELVAELDRMAAEIRSIGVEQDNEGGVGNHLADDGSNVMEGERLQTMSGDLQEVLTQVNSALERLDSGEFGICQRCHQPIGADRLEAFPYVAFCINCQTIIERERALQTGR